jgi:chitin synthase
MSTRPGRAPSPGHPASQGYQLEDAGPYGRPGGSPGPGRHNLEIPMGPGRHTPSDRLQAQPTVSFHPIDIRRIHADSISTVLCREYQQLIWA